MIDRLKRDCLQSSVLKHRENFNPQLYFHKGSIKLNELKLYVANLYQGDSEHNNILKIILVQLELRKKFSKKFQQLFLHILISGVAPPCYLYTLISRESIDELKQYCEVHPLVYRWSTNRKEGDHAPKYSFINLSLPIDAHFEAYLIKKSCHN